MVRGVAEEEEAVCGYINRSEVSKLYRRLRRLYALCTLKMLRWGGFFSTRP